MGSHGPRMGGGEGSVPGGVGVFECSIFVACVEDYARDDAIVDGLLNDGFEVVGWCHGG